MELQPANNPVTLTPIWLEGGDHLLVGPADSPFKGECHGVLHVKITNLQCIGVAESQAACNCCCPYSNTWNCLKLFGGNVRSDVAARYSGEIVKMSRDITQCVCAFAFNTEIVKGVVGQ
jgi:hypothetical protein